MNNMSTLQKIQFFLKIIIYFDTNDIEEFNELNSTIINTNDEHDDQIGGTYTHQGSDFVSTGLGQLSPTGTALSESRQPRDPERINEFNKQIDSINGQIKTLTQQRHQLDAEQSTLQNKIDAIQIAQYLLSHRFKTELSSIKENKLIEMKLLYSQREKIVKSISQYERNFENNDF